MQRPGGSPAADDGRRRLVVIGNGMAGARAVEEILARGGASSSRSPCSATSRTATTTGSCSSRAVRRGVPRRDLPQLTRVVRRRTTSPCTPGSGSNRIDRFAHAVFSDDGQVTPYDKLIIATGSRSFMPPMDGMYGAEAAAARGVRLPHHRRHPRHGRLRHSRRSPPSGGDRRRPARAGGRARPAEPRHRGRRRALRQAPDERPARPRRRRGAAAQHGPARHRCLHQHPDHRDLGTRQGPRRPARATAPRSPATSWWSRPASGPTPTSP